MCAIQRTPFVETEGLAQPPKRTGRGLVGA